MSSVKSIDEAETPYELIYRVTVWCEYTVRQIKWDKRVPTDLYRLFARYARDLLQFDLANYKGRLLHDKEISIIENENNGPMTALRPILNDPGTGVTVSTSLGLAPSRNPNRIHRLIYKSIKGSYQFAYGLLSGDLIPRMKDPSKNWTVSDVWTCGMGIWYNGTIYLYLNGQDQGQGTGSLRASKEHVIFEINWPAETRILTVKIIGGESHDCHTIICKDEWMTKEDSQIQTIHPWIYFRMNIEAKGWFEYQISDEWSVPDKKGSL